MSSPSPSPSQPAESGQPPEALVKVVPPYHGVAAFDSALNLAMHPSAAVQDAYKQWLGKLFPWDSMIARLHRLNATLRNFPATQPLTLGTLTFLIPILPRSPSSLIFLTHSLSDAK